MNRRLPAWQIFTSALLLIWGKRGFALRIAWPLILFHILAGLAVSAGYLADFTNPVAVPEPKNIGDIWNPRFLWTLCIQFIGPILMSIIAVFWHRNILLNETHAPAVPLRFDGLMWRYVGYWILVFLIISLIVLVGGSLIGIIMTLSDGLPAVASTGETGYTILMFLFMIPFLLWLLVVFFRFSLVLPAAAIGRRGFGLRMAWNLTRGNSWQILKINLPIVVFGFVVGLVLFFISLSVGYMSGGVPIWLFLLANTFVNYIFVLLG